MVISSQHRSQHRSQACKSFTEVILATVYSLYLAFCHAFSSALAYNLVWMKYMLQQVSSAVPMFTSLS